MLKSKCLSEIRKLDYDKLFTTSTVRSMSSTEILSSANGFAKDREFNRALEELSKLKLTPFNDEREKVDALITKAHCLNRLGKGEEALTTAEEAYNKSVGLGYPALTFNALIEIGEALVYFGRVEECASIGKECSETLDVLSGELTPELGSMEASLETLIGRVCIMRGERKSCLKHYNKALTIRSRTSNDPELAETLTDMAYLQGSLDKLEEALELFDRSLLLEGQKFTHNRVRCLRGKGYVHLMQGKIDEAREVLEQGLRIAEELRDVKACARFNTNLAICSQRQKAYDQALNHLEAALVHYDLLGTVNLTCGTIDQLFHLSLETGNTELAARYLKQLKELASYSQNKEISSVYEMNKSLLQYRFSTLELERLKSAEQQFRNASGSKYGMYELKVRAVLYLCEVLLLEFQRDNRETIFSDIGRNLSLLEETAINNGSNWVLCESYLVRAKVAAYCSQEYLANSYLNQVVEIATCSGLKELRDRAKDFLVKMFE